MKLTENQEKILYFISKYRWKYGAVPTLREMVEELKVSDNKSMLRIIEALVKKGYLNRDNKKTRTVSLTSNAQKLLGNYLLPLQYKKQPVSAIQPASLPKLMRNDVSASFPAPEFHGYEMNKIKTDGTNVENNLQAIVETAVIFAINKYFNGSSLTSQELKREISHDIGEKAVQIYNSAGLPKYFAWGILLTSLIWIYNIIFGNSFNAFIYATISIIIINLLKNK